MVFIQPACEILDEYASSSDEIFLARNDLGLSIFSFFETVDFHEKFLFFFVGSLFLYFLFAILSKLQAKK